MYSSVQAHYISAPLFSGGMDLYKEKMGLSGDETNTLILPPIESIAPQNGESAKAPPRMGA